MTKHLIITGLVQGVGYRASFERQAAGRGLRGWVRNRRDGSVEAMVDGDVHALDSLISWAHQGPPAARVAGVAIKEAEACSEDGFSVLPTV